ncbi:MAG: DotU family type IV/VI secretion system protein [Calditrichaeota bacterium]|nr:MAG: DotU family type IV/VI secretion system protein [Calditrichota bacterium]
MAEKMRLADICADSFMLVLQMRATQEFGDPLVLRERILHLLEKMEHQARQNNYDSQDIQNAKFALIAFIDETIIASQWSQKQSWLSNPLQLQLYNRFDAGEEFFNKLDEIRKRFHSNTEVLEVFYLCLVLGFKGKYGLVEQEKLRIVIDELYQDLRHSIDKSLKQLSPNGKRKDEITEVIKKEIPIWTFGVGAVSLGILFYMVLVLLSKGTASDVIEIIRGLL